MGESEYPSIRIFILDTLREDSAEKFKEILLKNGFLSVNNVFSTSPWTVPSHASLFTGLYPLQHGVHMNPKKKTRSYQIPSLYKPFMLNSVLKMRYNYSNYFYSANPFVTPIFGYDDFNVSHIEEASLGLFYSTPPSVKKILWLMDNQKSGIEKFSATSKEFIRKREFHNLIKWYISLIFNKVIAKNYVFRKIHSLLTNFPQEKGVTSITKKISEIQLDDPYLLFVNLMEPHEPYELQSGYVKQRIINLKTDKIDIERNKKWKAIYEKYNKYVINKTLNLIDIVESNHNNKQEITIITSDHGQLFGEHNRMGHQTFLYDELIRIPFYIKTPDNYPIKNNNDKQKSITNVKKMILNTIKNGYIDLEDLSSEIIYAETYGINLQINTNDPDEKKNIEKLDKYRIRAISSNEDVIFNVSDFRYEDINFNEIPKDKKPNIHNEILKYLNNNLKKTI